MVWSRLGWTLRVLWEHWGFEVLNWFFDIAFSSLTLLVGCQEDRPVYKKLSEGAGVVICLE